MANATDNLYVNITANTSGFTDKMKSAMKPLRDFMQVMQSIMALGGAAMIINKVAQAVGDMEKAYAKLHPESQKAVGSLGQWNDAMATMKADQGAFVASVLTPIRAAFLNIIDPVNSATYEIRQLQKAMQEISDKYLTTERKQFKDREDAMKQLAAATKTYNTALENQSKLEAELKVRQQEYLKAQELARLDTGSGGKVSIDTTSAQQAMNAASAAVDANRKLISASLVAQRNIQEYLAAQAKDGEKTGVIIKEITDAERIMLEYLDKNVGLQAQRLEIAQEYMDVMDQVYAAEASATGVLSRGTKSGSRGTVRPGVGRKGDGPKEEAADVRDLTAEWQRYAEVMSIVATSMGEAFATGDYIEGLRQMTQGLLNFIAKEAIAAALRIITDQGTAGIPLAAGLLALGGVAMVGSAAMSASGGGGGGSGVELPRMASGGIVTRPTLAMIGEAGPEAVVPLGRGGGGGTTVIVQGSIWQTEDLAVAIAREQARW